MKRRWSSEHGAVAVTFAVLLVGLLGLAMVAVDVGSLLATKRDVVADTDAAALAGAKALAERSEAECQAAQIAADPFATPAGVAVSDFLDLNRSNEHRDVDLQIVCGAPGSGSGRVVVAASQPATLTFAGLFGLANSNEVAADTTAQFGPAGSGKGLRPLSVCLSHPAVDLYLTTGAPGPYTLMYSKDATPPPSARLPAIPPLVTSDGAGSGNLVADCAEDPGNWGLTCFTGPTGPSGCGASTLEGYILEGFPGEVVVDQADPTQGDCNDETSGNQSCNEGGGVKASLEPDFAQLHCNAGSPSIPAMWPAASTCEYQFPILALGDPSMDGSGNYYPAALLGVVLRDSYIHGAKYAWFTFEFTNITVSGKVGGGAPGGGVRAVNICGVDHDGATDYCGP